MDGLIGFLLWFGGYMMGVVVTLFACRNNYISDREKKHLTYILDCANYDWNRLRGQPDLAEMFDALDALERFRE